ncbi:MAG: hypothetical protein IPP99_12305 [Chitinophagaceae bacterium]|nr:hypothetical protein [Chitinophagaceae bacterium]
MAASLTDVGGYARYTRVKGFYNQLEAAGAITSSHFLHDPHVLYWEEKDTWITQDLTKPHGTGLRYHYDNNRS